MSEEELKGQTPDEESEELSDEELKDIAGGRKRISGCTDKLGPRPTTCGMKIDKPPISSPSNGNPLRNI